MIEAKRDKKYRLRLDLCLLRLGLLGVRRFKLLFSLALHTRRRTWQGKQG
jgi:hypothetical protein